MKLLTIISSLLLLINTATPNSTEKEPNIFEEKYEEATHKEPNFPIAISDIVIYEVEDKVKLAMSAKKHKVAITNELLEEMEKEQVRFKLN